MNFERDGGGKFLSVPGLQICKTTGSECYRQCVLRVMMFVETMCMCALRCYQEQQEINV